MEIEIIETILNGRDPSVVIQDIKMGNGEVYQINVQSTRKGPYVIELFDIDQGIIIFSYDHSRAHKQTIVEMSAIEYIQILEGV